MKFKDGENGPYASCDVVGCDFWSGDPEEIKNHIVDVHNRAEEDANNLIEEFEDFREENTEDGEEKETIEKPSFVSENMIAEQVHDGGLNKFAVWNGGDIEYKHEIDLGGKTLVPRVDDPLEMGAIHLPEKATDYESTNKLLGEIKEYIHRWVDMSGEFEEMSAWYVLLTWVYDRLSTIPYLRFHGDFGTGKTQALKTIGGLCYKAIDTSGCTTSAAIERLVTNWSGSILMNEADFYNSDTQADIVKLLNEGFESGGLVMKGHKEKQDEVVAKKAYAPKILATRRRWEDQALESRCLTEEMRETERDDILPVRPKKFHEKQQELRNKLLMYRFKNYRKIDESDIEEIWPQIREMNLERRLIQATISFSVLFQQDEEMFERFINFLEKHQKKLIEERAATFDGGIVRAIYELKDTDHITCSHIATNLEEKQNFKDVRPSTVGKHLKNLGLETKYRKIDGETKKPLVSDEGQINKIFKRYLPDHDGDVSVKAVRGVKGTYGHRRENKEEDDGNREGPTHGVNDLNPLNEKLTPGEKLTEILDNNNTLPPEKLGDYFENSERRERAASLLETWEENGRVMLDEDSCWRWVND